MKLLFKIILALSLVIILCILVLVYYWINTPDIAWLQNKIKSQEYSWVIRDKNGEEIYRDDNSRFVSINNMPQWETDYIAYFEDQSFYKYPGFDPFAMLERVISSSGGGSTLDMQVIRSLTNARQRTVNRKLREIALALKLNFALTKPEIMQLYLNISSFGGIKGIYNASEYYFNKTPQELKLNELIYLIASLPGRIDVEGRFYRYANRLYENNIITKPLIMPQRRIEYLKTVPYAGLFVDHVLDEVYAMNKVELNEGIIINTTLDKRLNMTIGNLIEQKEQEVLKKDIKIKVSFALSDSAGNITSYIVGGSNLIGNYDDLDSPYSLPASRFKTIVYGLWINKFYPNTSIKDLENYSLPVTYRYPYSNKTVRDYGNGHNSTLWNAVAKSLNAPPLFLANDVIKLPGIIKFCSEYNVNLLPYPSMALGAQGTSELDLLQMYLTLIGDGKFHKLNYIRDVQYQNSGVTILNHNICNTVIDPSVPVRLRELLSSTLEGTSKGLLDSKIIKDDLHKGLEIYNKTGSAKRQFGCTGAFKWEHKTYFYTLSVESFDKGYRYSSQIAVPILGEIIERIIKMKELNLYKSQNLKSVN